MGVGQVLGEQPGVLRGAGGAEPGGAQQPPREQDQGDHQDQAGNHKVSASVPRDYNHLIVKDDI